MFTFPNKGDTGWFCQVSLFLWWFFCQFVLLFPDSVLTNSHGRVALQPEVEKSPIYCSLCAGMQKSKWMLENNYILPLFSSEESPKKVVANVRLKMSLAGLHISDSFVYQRNTTALKKEERFAVLYIKWCLFSILTLKVTSEGATSTGFCTYMINVNSSLLI